MDSLLSLLIWLPILGAVLVLLIGNNRISIARWVSVSISILVFVLSVTLFLDFDTSIIEFLLLAGLVFLFLY